MLKHIILACTAIALISTSASAATITSETAAFYKDAGTPLPIARVPGYVDRAVMTSNATKPTLTVPTWATDNLPSRSGLAVFNTNNGAAIWGVCAESATASRCSTTTAPWTPTSGDVTTGTDFDPMPTAYWLEPLGGSRITSLTFITDTSNTVVWVRYYKAK